MHKYLYACVSVCRSISARVGRNLSPQALSAPAAARDRRRRRANIACCRLLLRLLLIHGTKRKPMLPGAWSVCVQARTPDKIDSLALRARTLGHFVMVLLCVPRARRAHIFMPAVRAGADAGVCVCLCEIIIKTDCARQHACV